MSVIPRLPFSLNELRPLVLESFKGIYETQYLNVCSNVATLVVSKEIVPDPHRQNNVFVQGGQYELNELDQDNVREIIWNLIVEGILTIGINASSASWPWIKVTEYGRKVLESEQPVPHDPSGFLGRLHQEIPSIDPIIVTYIQESLKTYNINCLLSSTITLGSASEKSLLLLIEAFSNALQSEDRRKKFVERTSGKMIKRQFEEFTKALEGIKGNMPGDIIDGLDTVLLGIFEMIRNNRNDAGHPTGKSVQKEVVFANLQVFIVYCKKVYQVMNYFNQNPIH